ncbi:MAG: hypothetical protein J1E04_01545 [Alistipes sp.]|nr:hypothetical protein [Alistipes sp.]
MKNLLKKTVLAAVLLAAGIGTAAARQPEVTGCETAIILTRPAFEPQHEFRLSAGAYPIITDYGHLHDYFSRDRFVHRRSAMMTAGAWTLSYGYRIKKWIDLSAAFTYYGEYAVAYSNYDNSRLFRDNRHCYALMPVARFTWLNTRWVRLYSTLGIGVLFDTQRRDNGLSMASVSGQFVPAGIAVGKSFFGFAELGIGTQGCLLLGLGYKFNNKCSSK